MKTTLIAILLTLSLTAFAKDKTSDKTSTSADIYTEVRDIMR